MSRTAPVGKVSRQTSVLPDSALSCQVTLRADDGDAGVSVNPGAAGAVVSRTYAPVAAGPGL
ncbi:MAG: hypothetical protein KY464_13590, partial [Gemmatimonadetes bacterium]|nr:hypothetical protein [Gemmatimonadota bacterium]